MNEKILICVAWPYANGSLHIGQTAGAYIPADIFARYHRAKGNDVLMVSGSDSHGTPVTLTAEDLGISPKEVFQKYHQEFVKNWEELGITFDLFTSTHTKNHQKVAQDIFLKLYEKKLIYKDFMTQPFCEQDQRFLADRYVNGTCPKCNDKNARGDQCDNCGITLDPKDLIDMKCKLCDSTPKLKKTEHFFLKLSNFQDTLLSWLETKDTWKPNVKNFSMSYIKSGLKDRPITRDIEWGIPVPLKNYENKKLYVWFEAVIGYLSASIEWSDNQSSEISWKDFWKSSAKSYYFMGKDNIPFHSIIWPAILMGYDNLNLPHDIPANEYLNIEGSKQSTSRNWAVWLPEYLSLYDPDPLRYAIASNMPENSDSDFSWQEYTRANNDELVATYGNLVNRVMTLTHKNFEGKIPKPGPLDNDSIALLNTCNQKFVEISENIEKCKFRSGLEKAMALAKSANQYLDHKEPWKTIKNDIESTQTTIWTCLSVINCLKVVLYPYLPFSSQQLHKMLGFTDNQESSIKWSWDKNLLPPGIQLEKSAPLFKKLDDSIIETETKKIGKN